MSSVNKATLIGNLGKDPEIRKTQSGDSVANFSVATSQKVKGEDRTEWHRIVMFGKLADIAERYLRKGSKVYLEGQIQYRKWTDKNGQERQTTEIVVGGFGGVMVMLDGKQDRDSGDDYEREAKGRDGATHDDMDSEIPF